MSTEPLPQGKVLCLMRGCPGSGKSYLAQTLKGDGVILSSDDYHVVPGRGYLFDGDRVGEAHDWNKNRAREHLEKGTTPIIIDNTNIECWQMKPYVAMALEHQYEVIFREPDTEWKYKSGSLALRNVHGVKQDKIKKMLAQFEHNVTVESVMNSTGRPS